VAWASGPAAETGVVDGVVSTGAGFTGGGGGLAGGQDAQDPQNREKAAISTLHLLVMRILLE
jgi:hypothetical protein